MGARHSESETGLRPSPRAVRVAVAFAVLGVTLILLSVFVLVFELFPAFLLVLGFALIGVLGGAGAGRRILLLALLALLLLLALQLVVLLPLKKKLLSM